MLADREGTSRKLRAEAEKKVARSADKSAPLKKHGLDKLVHELQVHQVELEMQNEELRQAQGQLNTSRNDYVDLYDFAPMGYLTFNGDALITEVNLTGAALLGVERPKLLKRRFRQFVAPADAERWDRHFVSVLQQGEKQSCDLLLRRRDGSTLYARLDSIRMEMDDGTCIVRTAMSDITERQRLQEYLEKERQEFRLIVDSSPIIIFFKDQEGRFVRVNKTFAEALKIPEEEFLGKTVFDLYPAKIAQDMANDDQEVIKLGRPKFNIIERYESASGIRWVQTDKVPILDENGVAVGLLGFAQDITERKRAEDALSESEARYRLLAEHTKDTIRLMDMNLKTTYLSPSVEKLHGFTFQEISGLPLEKQITPESFRVASRIISEELPRVEADLGYNPVQILDLEYYCKDGTTIWEESKLQRHQG